MHEQRRLRSGIRAVDLRPHHLLGERRQGGRVDHRADHGARRQQPAVLPLVPRWLAQHLLQRPRPPRARRPRRPGGADLRQPGHRHGRHLHLRRAAREGGHVRRCPRVAGRREGRPGRRLHADGAGGRRRDARLRAARRHPLGRLRWLRTGRACRAHRRRQAGRHRGGELRHRAEPGGRVQADAGCGARPQQPHARVGHRAPAPAGPGGRRRARHRLGGDRLGRAGLRRRARRLRRGRGHRPALRALHLRHDRPPQGHRARQRWPRGGPALVDGEHLRHRPRRRVVHGIRRGVGRRALLHRLRPPAHRRDHRSLRGQTGRHARRERLLAGHRRPRREGDVHGPHRLPRDQARGRDRRPDGRPRPVQPRVRLPRRRAARPRHLRVDQ